MDKLLPVLSIICVFLVIFISGCVGGGNINQLVKQVPEVQAFLNEHPNAQITAVLWNKDYVESNMDKIQAECLPAIEKNKEYYKVDIREGESEITVWVREEGNKAVCIYVHPQSSKNQTSAEEMLHYIEIVTNGTHCDTRLILGTETDIEDMKTTIDFTKFGGESHLIPSLLEPEELWDLIIKLNTTVHESSTHPEIINKYCFDVMPNITVAPTFNNPLPDVAAKILLSKHVIMCQHVATKCNVIKEGETFQCAYGWNKIFLKTHEKACKVNLTFPIHLNLQITGKDNRKLEFNEEVNVDDVYVTKSLISLWKE